MITPKCISGENCIAYSSTGYLLPCCWADQMDRRLEFSQLLLDKFKLENVSSVDDIIRSDEWQSFYKGLLEDPDNAPTVCKNYCKSDYNNKIEIDV